MKTLFMILTVALLSTTLFARENSPDYAALMAKVKQTRETMRVNLHAKMRMARQSQHIRTKAPSRKLRGTQDKRRKNRLRDRIRLHR